MKNDTVGIDQLAILCVNGQLHARKQCKDDEQHEQMSEMKIQYKQVLTIWCRNNNIACKRGEYGKKPHEDSQRRLH